jgi:hypothetical protein
MNIESVQLVPCAQMEVYVTGFRLFSLLSMECDVSAGFRFVAATYSWVCRAYVAGENGLSAYLGHV